MCLCACTAALGCVGARLPCCVYVCVYQTLSSVQQLVDIEPSPVSAMRMTLAQVVITLVSIPIFIFDHGSSIPLMSIYLSVCAADIHLNMYMY